MANGDKAAQRGWSVVPSTEGRNLGWDRINYTLDRAAEQAARLDVVEAVVAQPIFSVSRSSTPVNIPYRQWTSLAAALAATPDISSGFANGADGTPFWNAGQLLIPKTGLWRIDAHVQFVTPSQPLASAGVQVVKNTASPDTVNTIAKGENSGQGASASRPVRLVAGDVLQVLAYQWRADGQIPIALQTGLYDVTFSAEWSRA